MYNYICRQHKNAKHWGFCLPDRKKNKETKSVTKNCGHITTDKISLKQRSQLFLHFDKFKVEMRELKKQKLYYLLNNNKELGAPLILKSPHYS